MAVSIEEVKALREKTGVGIMDCKKALETSGGDMEKALLYLRKKGFETAQKRGDRETSQGQVGSYIHMNGKIGTLVEVNCETDFVARNEEFAALVKDLAMQVAAPNPLTVRREDISEEVIEEQKKFFRNEFAGQKKPENILEKIIENKLNLFFEEKCLLEQPYLRDDKKKVEDVLRELIAKTGEKIVIRRFVRFQLGGE